MYNKSIILHAMGVYRYMVLKKSQTDYFAKIPFGIKSYLANSKKMFPLFYTGESFFANYFALKDVWLHHKSQKIISKKYKIAKYRFQIIEKRFCRYGCIGLLPILNPKIVDSFLEKLIILVKEARPHEQASYTLKLASAYRYKTSLDTIRITQRSWGYGHRMDEKDKEFWTRLQHILSSIETHINENQVIHDKQNRSKTFYNYDKDTLQHRIELFQELSELKKKRQIRPVLRKYGIHPNRYYELKERYMQYGVWGLIDLVQTTKQSEKISKELELLIIEKKFSTPKLGAGNMIKQLDLQCSRALVRKIFIKWRLLQITEPVILKGVSPSEIPENQYKKHKPEIQSAKTSFPNLIETENLKVHSSFSDLVKTLRYKRVNIGNPGALIAAPFLDMLGPIEAMRIYGPESLRGTDITNSIIVNVLRIITGFPTINDFTKNSDRSVAIGAGLSLNPKKSRYYDSLDEVRFEHLQKLRNDAAIRAKELFLIEGREIAIDYHCDPVDTRYPSDKSFTKAPDKNGNMVYAHRPQIIWDSNTNTIINIAYHEGASRAPTALYKFCEENLLKIIDKDVIDEIYADSEYTGEKQLLYLIMRTQSDITMCLKQNKKIKKWRDEIIQEANWQDYGNDYEIASKDATLAETQKMFRIIVKRKKDTGEIRCFGSTHTDLSPLKILESYHIRWPVETGIKNLLEDYFLDKPTGTSPEKVELHYYCIMLARYVTDYFLSALCAKVFVTHEEWESNLSTVRSLIFSNQNCELQLNDQNDFVITYLDGDKIGILKRLQNLLERRKQNGTNKVSWWGNRGVLVKIKDQFAFK